MSFIATAFGTKVAIAALSLVAIGGGTAVAAANGALPIVPSSETATATPTATPTDGATGTATPTPSPTPSASAKKGPDATGPAAFGLCTAYTAGGLNSHSVAYASLLKASTSAGSIAAYCVPILAAHKSNSHKPTPTPAPTPAADSSLQSGQSGADNGKSSSVSHGH